MSSNHLVLYCPLLLPSVFPSIRIFSKESALCIRWPKYWSFSFASVLSMNIQGWFPLGLTGSIALLSNRLSWLFFSTTVWKHQFFNAQFSSVAQLCPTLCFSWTAACQASLSITNTWSLLKFMCIELVTPYNHLILCCPLLLLPSIFPSIRVFSNGSVLLIDGQSIGVSASASFLPMNIQDWFSLGWTGLISLQSKGLSRVFSNTTVQKH